MRHRDEILSYLLEGYTLTQMEAITKFGCMRLGARIFELKEQGYPIVKEMIKVPVRDGEYTRVASYYMLPEGRELK